MMVRKELEEVEKYKNYPEGSAMKRYYDSVFLSFSEYLKKYYANPDLSTWEIWQKKYLKPALDKERHEEMVKNFGYVSLEMHDFESQYQIYEELKIDHRLDDSTRRFIGFLAGAHFFERYKITWQEWFKMKNWSHPEHKNEDGKTISEILNYTFGINMLKSSLPQMPFWKRF